MIGRTDGWKKGSTAVPQVLPHHSDRPRAIINLARAFERAMISKNRLMPSAYRRPRHAVRPKGTNMKFCICVVLTCVIWQGALAAEKAVVVPESGWPAWRGPLATGVSTDAVPPLRWDEKTNIRWKVAIPGKGVSSPIVWQDRVFVTTAVETGKLADPEAVRRAESETPEFVRKSGGVLPSQVLQFTVLALKRSDGSVLWKQVVCEQAPHEGTHGDGSWASGSPVTDGTRLYVYFGSYGLYCFDLDGKKIWEKQLGQFKMSAPS